MALLHNVIITAQVTYSQLVTMVNSGTLAPAHYYEITDYRTIYKQPNTGSILGGSASPLPSKPFPIIVQALTNDTLNTEALVNPTVDFPNANAWKIKYDLNLPVSFDVFTSIDWPNVTQIIADNIADAIDFQYGDSGAHGLTPAQTQTYINTDFALYMGVTGPEAEELAYQAYIDLGFSPALPINTTPTLSYDSKYSWADITSMGVIYEMTDENNNTAGYDFKNVRFVRDKTAGETGFNVWLNGAYYDYNLTLPLTINGDHFYTFNYNPTNTVGGNLDYSNDPDSVGNVNTNVIKPLFQVVTGPSGTPITVRTLNNNVFLLAQSRFANNNTFAEGSLNNTFGYNIQDNTFGANATLNRISTGFQNNIIGRDFSTNTISQNCQSNNFGNGADSNESNSNLSSNTFGDLFVNNIIGLNCNNNVIDVGCQGNSFGNGFTKNGIGTLFQNNTITNTFTMNQIASSFQLNNFSGSATSNTFGSEFKSNTITTGSGFSANTIGSRIQSCNFNGNFSNSIVQGAQTSKTFPSSNGFVYNIDNSTYSIGSSLNTTFFTTRANNFIMSQTLPNTGTLTGHSNVGITSAVGMSALTSGSQNTAMGELSLSLLTTGNFNTGIGATALRRVTNGSYNTFIGNQSGQFVSTSSYNTGYGGLSAGTLMGSFNIMLGAGNITNLGSSTETIGDGNILIGKDTQRTKNTVNDNIVIGNLSYAQNTSNTTIIGTSLSTLISNIMILGGATQNVIFGDSAPAADNGYRIQINAIGKGGINLNGGNILHTQDAVTGTATTSAHEISSTWNTSGNVTLIKANVTNTASGTTSKLLDLQIGGVSKLTLDKNGQLFFGGYGTSTFTGTVTNLLAVTSTGGVIETSIANVSPWTVSSNDIYNSNSGNVGIGTATPNAGKLHVFQMATASETTVAIRPVWNTSGTPTALEVNPQIISSTDQTSKLIDVKFSSTSRFNVQQDGTINFGVYGAGTISGTATRQLGVTSAGKVIELALPTTPGIDAVLAAGNTLTTTRNIELGGNELTIKDTGGAGDQLALGPIFTDIGDTSGTTGGMIISVFQLGGAITIGNTALGNGTNFVLNDSSGDVVYYYGGTQSFRLYSAAQTMSIGSQAPTASLHIKAGNTNPGTAPIKLMSGSLMTTAEVGAIEFLTDKYYATITTGAARKELTLNDAALTANALPIATTNGRITNSLITYNAGSTRFLVGSSSIRALQFEATDNTTTPTTVTQYRHNSVSNSIVQSAYTLDLPNTSTFNVIAHTSRFGDNSAGTAIVDIRANAAGTANRTPLKFGAGTLVATPENGAFEYNGTDLYFTIGSTRSAVVLGATAGTTIYTGDGTLGGARAIDVNGFNVTWNDTGLFRIVNGTTSGGTYDFTTNMSISSYDATNSANLTVDPVTGLTFEYTLLSGPTVLSSLDINTTGVKLTGIQEFANNAAAITGGLTAGYLYRTGDDLKIVH